MKSLSKSRGLAPVRGRQFVQETHWPRKIPHLLNAYTCRRTVLNAVAQAQILVRRYSHINAFRFG